jgi:cysteine synthase
VLFNTGPGRAYLGRRGVSLKLLEQLGSLGLSSICNVVAAIKLAKHARLGPDDAIVTVATDGAPMYHSERDRTLARDFGGIFGPTEAAATCGEAIDGAGTDHMLELTDADRRRIFNLGYYTWVEQQGIGFDEFVERRDQATWTRMRELLPAWDEMIVEFNARAAVPVR